VTDPFDPLCDRLLGVEGGYVNDPKDPGGETIWGVTAAVARAEGYAGPMASMTRDQAKAIYRSRYWHKPGFDRIAALSSAIAAELFDTGVNMGPPEPSAWLQRALNVLNEGGRDFPDLKPDGQVGSVTVAALAAFLVKRGPLGEKVILAILNGFQAVRYVQIAEARPASERFEFGWIANRVVGP